MSEPLASETFSGIPVFAHGHIAQNDAYIIAEIYNCNLEDAEFALSSARKLMESTFATHGDGCSDATYARMAASHIIATVKERRENRLRKVVHSISSEMLAQLKAAADVQYHTR